MKRSFGFIILRHVNSITTNEYWLRCYSSIRKLYADNLIVILDDDSDYVHVHPVETDDSLGLHNVKFVYSCEKRRGELLPYYYYLRNKGWFEKAVFVHDSVFLRRYVDFSLVENQVFWDFHHDTGCDETLCLRIEELISACKNSERLSSIYLSKTWRGCFGGMAVFTHGFVEYIDRRFSLKGLCRHIQCRHDRMALERLIGIFFEYYHYHTSNRSGSRRMRVDSILGNINEYCVWGYSYDMYLFDAKVRLEERKRRRRRRRQQRQRQNHSATDAGAFVPIALTLPIVKVWTGR